MYLKNGMKYLNKHRLIGRDLDELKELSVDELTNHLALCVNRLQLNLS